MKKNLSRFEIIMGFRLSTLVFSFILFSVYASPLNVVSHAVIIICLLIANVVVILMQRENLDGTKSTILWCVEIIGVFVLLVLTGGIHSLYFWMILNPMLVGLNTNEKIHKTQHLILIVLTVLLFLTSKRENEIQNLHSIQMLFGIVVVVIYSYITGVILREQQKKNTELALSQYNLDKTAKANQKLSESIMESVELLEKMAIIEDYENVIEVFSEYMSIILGTDRCFLMTYTNERFQMDKELVYSHAEISKYIKENDLNELGGEGIYRFNSKNGDLILFSKMVYNEYIHYYGYAFSGKEYHGEKMVTQQLQFITKLHKIMIAKLNLFGLKCELLIKDEQNRIAEEMHDNVNQQLFALTCQVFNLKNALKIDLDIKRLKEITDIIYSTLQKTNKDLKEIIYRMSLEKNSNGNALEGVIKYIENLSTLYGIEIVHDIDREILYCESNVQNTIFRIINETIANGVKHGKAQKIEISIKSYDNQIQMRIRDDGVGINQFDLMKKEKGIGIANLKRMAEQYTGEFRIGSEGEGLGATVEITLKEVKII